MFSRKPWDKSTKGIFFDYNQFEKVPQNDDSENRNEQNEFAWKYGKKNLFYKCLFLWENYLRKF